MRKLSLIFIVALLALATYFIISPYLVLNKLKNAGENKDVQIIAEQIDFIRVKASLKEQLKQQIYNQSSPQNKGDATILGAMLAATMIDGVVDTMITPKTLELILDGKNISEKHLSPSTQVTQNNQDGFTAKNWEFDTSYQSLNYFAVTINHANKEKPVQIILQRDGLFDWKIVDIQLHLN